MNNKIKLIIILIIAMCIFIGISILGVLEPNIKNKNEHKCTTFVKYQEHYQITSVNWNYRDSFKCVECGKDWKD